MRRRVWQLAGLLALVLIAVLAWLVWAVRQEPEFYRQALAVSPTELAAQGNEMFNRSQRLSREVKRPGKWQEQFTALQINGFLAVEVPKILREQGKSLPPEWHDPRIEIADGVATLAVRYNGAYGESVVSISAEVFLAGPQEIGVRLRAPRVGSVPLPLGPLITALGDGARHAGVDLRWRQTDGDPVAIVRIHPARAGQDVRLDAIELGDGKLSIAGTTTNGAN